MVSLPRLLHRAGDANSAVYVFGRKYTAAYFTAFTQQMVPTDLVERAPAC